MLFLGSNAASACMSRLWQKTSFGPICMLFGLRAPCKIERESYPQSLADINSAPSRAVKIIFQSPVLPFGAVPPHGRSLGGFHLLDRISHFVPSSMSLFFLLVINFHSLPLHYHLQTLPLLLLLTFIFIFSSPIFPHIFPPPPPSDYLYKVWFGAAK